MDQMGLQRQMHLPKVIPLDPLVYIVNECLSCSTSASAMLFAVPIYIRQMCPHFDIISTLSTSLTLHNY